MSQVSEQVLSGDGGRALEVALWIDPVMLRRDSAFLRHLVMGLKAEGHRVTFIAPTHLDLSLLPLLGSPHLTYRWYPWERLTMVRRWRLAGVVEGLREHLPDVLVTWGTAEAGLVQVVAEATGLPVVVWCWDSAELFTPLTGMAQVKHLIASSRRMLDRVPQGHRVPVTLIHPGVYTDEAVACYDVDGQLPCLVSLDPLSDLKAYEPLLRACRHLADDGTDFLLFCYDAGRQEQAIWQMAQKLALLDRVSFVPFQHEAEPLLLHGDLFLHVLPSSRVNYATLDAMGRGLAVVTCPNHDADYLEDGVTCRVVKEPSAEAWYYVLADLTADRPAASSLARRGQQHVRETHEMTRALLQFVTVCRQTGGVPIRLTP